MRPYLLVGTVLSAICVYQIHGITKSECIQVPKNRDTVVKALEHTLQGQPKTGIDWTYKMKELLSLLLWYPPTSKYEPLLEPFRPALLLLQCEVCFDVNLKFSDPSLDFSARECDSKAAFCNAYSDSTVMDKLTGIGWIVPAEDPAWNCAELMQKLKECHDSSKIASNTTAQYELAAKYVDGQIAKLKYADDFYNAVGVGLINRMRLFIMTVSGFHDKVSLIKGVDFGDGFKPWNYEWNNIPASTWTRVYMQMYVLAGSSEYNDCEACAEMSMDYKTPPSMTTRLCRSKVDYCVLHFIGKIYGGTGEFSVTNVATDKMTCAGPNSARMKRDDEAALRAAQAEKKAIDEERKADSMDTQARIRASMPIEVKLLAISMPEYKSEASMPDYESDEEKKNPMPEHESDEAARTACQAVLLLVGSLV